MMDRAKEIGITDQDSEKMMNEKMKQNIQEGIKRNKTLWKISLRLEKLTFKLPLWYFPSWLLRLHGKWVNWNWRPVFSLYNFFSGEMEL